jgi:micrococcal nuclease
MSRNRVGRLVTGALIALVFVACSGTNANTATAAPPSSVPGPAASEPAAEATSSIAAADSPTVAPSPTAAPTPELLAGTVVEVVDGDTIHVQLPSGVEKVRIIGIDTPETVDPNRPASCFGPEATAFAKETLAGKGVTLEIDPTQDRRDRFDRLLAHVHVGDALYAAEAIAGGYGIHYVYERPSVHAAELAAAQASAKAADLGIWASCDGRVDLPLPPVVDPTPEPVAPTSAPPADAKCHPSYDPCVPNVTNDLDCKDIGFSVTIIGPDEYRLDGSDHDGNGCESYG